MAETNPTPGLPAEPGTASKKKTNGHTLVCVADPHGFTITLDMHTWEDHIIKRHPEMKGFVDLIAPTAEKPQLIQRSESGTCFYYRLTGRSFYKAADIFLSLVVNRNEATKTGTIRTAHLVRQVRSEGETIWASN
ncbi:MAG: hypothetical protein ABSB35_42375 [Bryobacteraceae bacterium]|jgi:hypothetical protein